MSDNNEINQWFIPQLQNRIAKINLFCFHHAGGSASFFNDWPSQLTPFVNLISVQLPGRDMRQNESFITNINILIEKLTKHSDIFSNKPFVLFGHSLGAIIAFELSRKLQKLSLQAPKCLIVSGYCAPKLSDTKEKIHLLPDPLFLKRLIEKYGGISEEILNCNELLNFVLPRIRADVYLAENYSYSFAPLLECPIFVMGGANDPSIHIDELLGWKEETKAQTKIFSFQGDHFFLQSKKASVLERINKLLTIYL